MNENGTGTTKHLFPAVIFSTATFIAGLVPTCFYHMAIAEKRSVSFLKPDVEQSAVGSEQKTSLTVVLSG